MCRKVLHVTSNFAPHVCCLVVICAVLTQYPCCPDLRIFVWSENQAKYFVCGVKMTNMMYGVTQLHLLSDETFLGLVSVNMDGSHSQSIMFIVRF